ncbi:MAG: hypothetical protein IPM42_05145 [Saprospiraceae bacterium]|nr:hypothetical protein [Saprospiraceae bacterium]
MKNHSIIYLTLVILTVLSCKLSENESVDNLLYLDDAHKVNSEKNIDNRTLAKGSMPSDHELFDMVLSDKSISWLDYYTYFIEKLNLYKNEHYYENLEWLNISRIVTAPDFKESASDEIKEELWLHIAKRRFINEPNIAFLILKSRRFGLKEAEVAKRAYSVFEINRNKFKNNPEGWLKHVQDNKDAYSQLQKFNYDRWGVPYYSTFTL